MRPCQNFNNEEPRSNLRKIFRAQRSVQTGFNNRHIKSYKNTRDTPCCLYGGRLAGKAVGMGNWRYRKFATFFAKRRFCGHDCVVPQGKLVFFLRVIFSALLFELELLFSPAIDWGSVLQEPACCPAAGLRRSKHSKARPLSIMEDTRRENAHGIFLAACWGRDRKTKAR